MKARVCRQLTTAIALIAFTSTYSAQLYAETSDTREIRWFFEDTVPQKVRAWFVSWLPGEAKTEPPGEHFYFLWDGRDDVGLKLREGKLELKLRDSVHTIRLLNGQVVGAEERWEKTEWQYFQGDADEVPRRFSVSGMKGKRVIVAKARQQRRYEVDAAGRLTPVARKKRRGRAVTVELTELTVNRRLAWTLGFDLIGPSAELEEMRTRTISALLRDYPGPQLIGERSYGYPKWLRQLGQ